MAGWGNRSHEVSILIIGGIGFARFLGAQPGSKISMTIIRPPQQGQGRGSPRSSSGAVELEGSDRLAWAGMASNLRARAMLAERWPSASLEVPESFLKL
jgi:hypothetical protein